MLNFSRRLIFVLGTGAILWFYSEFYFWGCLRPNETLLSNIPTYIIYSIITYAFLCVVYAFRVRSIWALYLAGGIYGWLVEGVAVSTAYDNFPWHVAWTALCWHSLISVLAGWYLMKRVMIQNNYAKTIAMCGAIAFFWSTWTAYWWTQPDFGHRSLSMFAYSAYIFAIALVAGYWLSNFIPASVFRPTWLEGAMLALLAVWWFIKTVVPHKPHALWILPPILLVTFAVLEWNRRTEPNDNAIVATQGRITLLNYLVVLVLLPSFAVFGYAQYEWQQVNIYMNKIFGSLSENAAVVLYAASVAKILTRKRSQQPVGN